ncbi:hypothetical protein [Haloprofundus sp. MHR1]|uniref:hypothetical protein n=1 Tax=Haloprofundus sp. MHR1 TaxID=2572921 RepID=UPI0010BE7796|nr:hypothetical protein [Haloprofundus sp. MHR1]QCJ45956.1 hypothetical protein FCF25_01945 [Haloprofundus sp. MHR1]
MFDSIGEATRIALLGILLVAFLLVLGAGSMAAIAGSATTALIVVTFMAFSWGVVSDLRV